MSILFASTRRRQSANARTFGLGILPQRDRLPIGQKADDRQWAAENLNADTATYSTEDGDWQTHEARTISRREWLELQTELATERFVAACDTISDRMEARREPEEAEVAEMGSQIGHQDASADVMPWSFAKDANHATSEDYAARYNAEKAARKAAEAAKPLPPLASVFTPAEIRQLDKLGMLASPDDGPAWTYSDAQLDAFEAEMAAKAKAVRKPKPVTMHQRSKAARLTRETSAKGGA